ncbi:hypothetical protein V492_01107 [Pseudogymnoascus sp. VKM F-4246]|nr:hypothetical protein V492_01107 [Pseudogymnoascus sp. VKM F-4246]
MRNHLLNGSVKKGPAKPQNFDMAPPQPPHGPHGPFVADGAVTTKLQQPLEHFSHGKHTYHGLYGENKHTGHVESTGYGKPDYMSPRGVSQSLSRSYETKPKPIRTIEHVEEGHAEQNDMEEIRRKRFRILREGDWLGLSIQRPLQLKYMEPENRDAIGKRRKLEAGYEARYSRVRDKIASPSAPNSHITSGDIFLRPGQNQPHQMQYGHSPGTKGSVRIFIDGRERNVRESSGSATNRPYPEYVQSSASSDVMLLDLEGGGSRPRPQHQLNPDIVNGNGYIPGPLEHCRQGSEEISMSSTGDYPSSGPRIFQINGPSRNVYAPSLQHQSSPILATDRTKTTWPNASPVVYQPTPRSSTTSRLLRSNSSTFDGSVAATAGRKGTVTASVAQDEKMWRSWLIPESDDEESPTWPVDDQGDEPSRGGYSTSRETTRSVSARLSSTDQNGQNGESEDIANYKIMPSMGTVRTSNSREPENDDMQLPKEKKDQDAAREAFALTEASKKLSDPTVDPAKKAVQEDPDAAWKKFVLSSDSDNESSTDEEVEPETGVSRKRSQGSSSKISLQVHPAETVVQSEPRLDDSSDMTSARVFLNPSTRLASSRPNGSEASVGFSETSLRTNGSARETTRAPTSILQASGRLSESVVSKQRKLVDPLARYMPKQLQTEDDIVMELPAPNISFERGLDDSLKQALHLGRSYARQEKARYATQGKEAFAKPGKERYVEQEKGRFVNKNKESFVKTKNKETRDIYDIPISDDSEEADGEQRSRYF